MESPAFQSLVATHATRQNVILIMTTGIGTVSEVHMAARNYLVS